MIKKFNCIREQQKENEMINKTKPGMIGSGLCGDPQTAICNCVYCDLSKVRNDKTAKLRGEMAGMNDPLCLLMKQFRTNSNIHKFKDIMLNKKSRACWLVREVSGYLYFVFFC